MIVAARLTVLALCAGLCAAPLVTWADDGAQTSQEAPAPDPIEALRTQVEALLDSTRAELEDVEDLLFDDPNDPDLQAIAADLRDSIAQLEELQAQLPEPAPSTGED